MQRYIASGTRFFSPGQTQWAPTLTVHDPNPPITLEHIVKDIPALMPAVTRAVHATLARSSARNALLLVLNFTFTPPPDAPPIIRRPTFLYTETQQIQRSPDRRWILTAPQVPNPSFEEPVFTRKPVTVVASPVDLTRGRDLREWLLVDYTPPPNLLDPPLLGASRVGQLVRTTTMRISSVAMPIGDDVPNPTFDEAAITSLRRKIWKWEPPPVTQFEPAITVSLPLMAAPDFELVSGQDPQIYTPHLKEVAYAGRAAGLRLAYTFQGVTPPNELDPTAIYSSLRDQTAYPGGLFTVPGPQYPFWADVPNPPVDGEFYITLTERAARHFGDAQISQLQELRMPLAVLPEDPLFMRARATFMQGALFQDARRFPFTLLNFGPEDAPLREVRPEFPAPAPVQVSKRFPITVLSFDDLLPRRAAATFAPGAMFQPARLYRITQLDLPLPTPPGQLQFLNRPDRFPAIASRLDKKAFGAWQLIMPDVAVPAILAAPGYRRLYILSRNELVEIELPSTMARQDRLTLAELPGNTLIDYGRLELIELPEYP